MTLYYGQRSQDRLSTCHHELQETFELYLSWQIYDITILHGWRGKELQNAIFADGNSKVKWPNSYHNMLDPQGNPLSDAVDFAPWTLLPNGTMGIPWADTHAFAVVGGLLLAANHILGYESVYGGDWDMDGTTTDQNLKDWGHIQRKRS